MNGRYQLVFVWAVFLVATSLGVVGFAEEGGQSILGQEYDLVGERSSEPQYYYMEREIRLIAEDGTPKGGEKYELRLMIEPGDRSLGEADRYTCRGLAMQKGDGPGSAFLSSQFMIVS